MSLSLALGMAAVNSGHNLLYLVFSTMLAMLLASGNVSIANLRGLTVQRRYPSECHAGQPVQAVLEVRNVKRWIASYGVRVDDFLIPEDASGSQAEPAGMTCFVPILRAGQASLCTMTLVAPRRGAYRLESARASSGYPFAFFRRARRLDPVPTRILAFPKLLPLSLIAPSMDGLLGNHETGRKGHGLGLFGLRNYQDGDPARLIHWKHSAKGMGLKLKEFEEEWTRSFRIMMDLRTALPLSEEVREHFEHAISVAATMARCMIDANCAVSLWTTQGRVPPGAGRNQLRRILRALALLAPQPWDVPLPSADPAPPGVPTMWIVFQDTSATQAAGVKPVIHPDPRARLIDARTIQPPSPPEPIPDEEAS